MEGTAIDAQEASRRLGYSLDQPHHAAIIWIEEADAAGLLERAAEALARCADTRSMLVVVANTATQWVWTHGGEPINMESLRRMIKALPGVHMTVATAGRGIEGFRSGHLDALATQRLLGRLHTGAGVVHADSMSLIVLMTQHIESVQQFVARTLGEPATADKSLRRRWRCFIGRRGITSDRAKAGGLSFNSRYRLTRGAEGDEVANHFGSM